MFNISKRKHQPKDGSFSKKPFLQVMIGSNGKPTKTGSIGRTDLIQDDGTILLYPQTEGTGDSYVIQEIKAPEGYDLDSTPIEFDIQKGKTFTVSNKIASDIGKTGFVNRKATGTLDFTKTRFASADPVPGATMEIYKDGSNELVLSAKTNKKGKFDKGQATKGAELINADGAARLEPGKYYFKEKEAPQGYILNEEEHKFEIEKGKVVVDTLKNEKENLFALIKKGVNDKPLAGAKIKIYRADGTEILEAATGSDGKLDKTTAKGKLKDENRITDKGELKLKVGSYYYKEISAPGRYTLDKEKHYFSITSENSTVEEIFKNLIKTPRLATRVGIGGKLALNDEGLKVSTGSHVVKDTIYYANLEGGKKYNVTGRLMKIVNGTPNEIAKKAQEFTADTSGIGTWILDFHAQNLEEGATYVVYEKAVSVENLVDTNNDGENDARQGSSKDTVNVDANGNSLLSHEDPKDRKQTIVVGNSSSSSGTTSGTGGSSTSSSSRTSGGSSSSSASSTSETSKDTKPAEPQQKTETTLATPDKVEDIIKNADKKDSLVVKENEDVTGKIQVEQGEHITLRAHPENGYVQIKDDGNWKYTPNKAFTGKDRFVVTVTKVDGSKEDVLVEIDVGPVPLGSMLPDMNVVGLPKTGGQNDMSLIGLALIAAGLLLQRKKGQTKSKSN